MKKLINEAYTKRWMILTAKEMRPANHFERVSRKTLDMLNERFRHMVIHHIHSHPSRGKTL
jgi:hypothetical protein